MEETKTEEAEHVSQADDSIWALPSFVTVVTTVPFATVRPVAKLVGSP